jgi:hypothetical protein
MCHRGASAFAIFPLEWQSNRLISDFIINSGVSHLPLWCSWMGVGWKVPNGSAAKCTPPKQEWPALFTLTFSEVSKFLECSDVPCCKGNRLAGTFCNNVHCSKLVFPVFSSPPPAWLVCWERWRLALCLQAVSSSDNIRDDSMAASVKRLQIKSAGDSFFKGCSTVNL